MLSVGVDGFPRHPTDRIMDPLHLPTLDAPPPKRHKRPIEVQESDSDSSISSSDSKQQGDMRDQFLGQDHLSSSRAAEVMGTTFSKPLGAPLPQPRESRGSAAHQLCQINEDALRTCCVSLGVDMDLRACLSQNMYTLPKFSLQDASTHFRSYQSRQHSTHIERV